jgi:hypothetical protein
MESLLTWFAYVGSCLVAPDATCRPFLAFVLLGAAASAALTLVLIAYRSAQGRDVSATEERRASLRTTEAQERVLHAVAARPTASNLPIRRHYRPVV